jgi:DNA-binding MarR family transcriptional regulator
MELTVSANSIIKPLRSFQQKTSITKTDRQPMTGTARHHVAASSEQQELISCLERAQDSFERRALSSMAEPLISTPLTMQQLKVLTMIAIDPEPATGHELAAQLKVSVATMSGLVDRLVEHGMVTRGEDPTDRRVRPLSVTPEGSATIRSLLSSSGTMPTPVLRRLAIEDLRALVQGVLALERAVAELAEGSNAR